MIRIARGKAETQGAGNVRFHVGAFDDSFDGRFDALRPGSLDGLCAYSILHLLDDRSAALARMFALIKPGGFFVSSTVCLGETWMPFSLIIGAMRLFGRAPRVVATISKETLVAEMRAAGFVDIRQPEVGAKPTTAFVVARKPG